jgi:hypothetical protein
MGRFTLLLTAGLLLCLATTAEAQRGSSRYNIPRRPTISPWMDLFSQETGPLDNYHSFVRPRQRLYNTLGNQNYQLQQQGGNIRNLGKQVTRMERPAFVRPTGTGSSYMNLSHYYPMQGTGRSIGGGSRSWSPASPSRGGGGGGNF